MKATGRGLARLPGWMLIILAVSGYVVFHQLQMLLPITNGATNLAALAQVVIMTIAKYLLLFFQYLIPLYLGYLSIAKLLGDAGPRSVYRKVLKRGGDQAAINGVTWYQFEQLVAEAFRRQGFIAAETSKGADGGVDLELKRGDGRYLVQCKKWRSARVGVATVRELYGVVAGRGATGGFVVTSGAFTRSAAEFAQGKNIALIDGVIVARWLKEGKGLKPESVMSAVLAPVQSLINPSRTCKICLGPLVSRTVKGGPRAGTTFLGCAAFPRCPGSRAAQ